MVERQRDQRPPNYRRLSWKSVYGGGSKDKEKEQTQSTLVPPLEGVELQSYVDRSLSSSAASLPSSASVPQQPSSHVPVSRTNSISESPSPASSRPTTPLFSRWSSSNVLTKQQADSNGLERTTSRPDSTKGTYTPETSQPRASGTFGRKSFSSMMGGLSSLSLTRISTDDGRGRSHSKPPKGESNQRARSSSASRVSQDDSRSATRSRSMSPFHFRRSRAREPSPSVGALAQSDAESDTESTRDRPRSAYASDDESQGDAYSDNGSDSEEDFPHNDQFDPVTEANTEANALVAAEVAEPDPLEISDPLGEGVNVVVPPEPYFPTTLNHTSSRNPRRRKSTRPEPLRLQTGRPVFQRDRCTISLTQGDPERALKASNRRPRRYVIASDLSDESRYAVEWGIGTVLRDGDEMYSIFSAGDTSCADLERQADSNSFRERKQRKIIFYLCPCPQATDR